MWPTLSMQRKRLPLTSSDRRPRFWGFSVQSVNSRTRERRQPSITQAGEEEARAFAGALAVTSAELEATGSARSSHPLSTLYGAPV